MDTTGRWTSATAWTVKSCGPGLPVLRPCSDARASCRGQESRSPRRARISRNPFAQGGPGCLGRTCGSYPVHFVRTGAMGAASSRPSLRPLVVRGLFVGITSGTQRVAGGWRYAPMREIYDKQVVFFDVIVREGGRSSTPRPLGRPLLSLEYWVTRLRG
jgi:hypothetical protein